MTCKDCIHYDACNFIMQRYTDLQGLNPNGVTCSHFKQREGRWLKNDTSVGYHCSCCGKDDFYAYLFDSDTGADELQDNFCPFCGADMRGDAK